MSIKLGYVWSLTWASVLCLACARSPHVAVNGLAQFDGENDHAGIVVSMSGPTQAKTVTGSDGTFKLTGLKPGQYRVAWIAPEIVESSLEKTIDVTNDIEVPTVKFHTVGKVVGRIIDAANGKPLQGVWLATSHSVEHALSGSDGAFELKRVKVGEVTVSGSAPGKAAALKRVKVIRGQTSDLGVWVLSEAASTLEPASVAGRVVLPDFKPASFAEVRIKNEMAERKVVADADGAFRFDDVRGGAVELHATLPGYEAIVSTVLLLKGTTGLAAESGLFPLSENPIELHAGRWFPGAVMIHQTPDGKTLVLSRQSDTGNSISAVSLDGGAERVVISKEELGNSSAWPVAFGPDSATMAIRVMPKAWSRNGPLFLASTEGGGRELLTQNGEAFVVGEQLMYSTPTSEGEEQVWALPVRFGATPKNLGKSHGYFWPYSQGPKTFWFSRGATLSDLQMVDWSSSALRRTVARGIDAFCGLAPDGRTVVVGRNEAPFFVDIESGQERIIDGAVKWTGVCSFTSDNRLVISTYSKSWVIDVVTAAVQTSREGALWAVTNSEVVLIRPRYDSVFDLSWYRNRHAQEELLAKNVTWFQASPDGKWLYFIDESNASDWFGRLNRLSLVDGSREVIESSAGVASIAQGGSAVLFVRRSAGTYTLMSFDPVGSTSTSVALVGWSFWGFTASVSPGGLWLAFKGPSDLWYAYEFASRRLKPLARGWSLDWLGPNVAKIGRSYWEGAEGTYYVPLN